MSKQEGEELSQQYKVCRQYLYLQYIMLLLDCILPPHSYTPLSPPQIKYVETSAKIQLNVEKAFHDLVRVIRQAQKPDNLKEKKKKKRRVCVVL